jgi:hypothetical protein
MIDQPERVKLRSHLTSASAARAVVTGSAVVTPAQASTKAAITNVRFIIVFSLAHGTWLSPIAIVDNLAERNGMRTEGHSSSAAFVNMAWKARLMLH